MIRRTTVFGCTLLIVLTTIQAQDWAGSKPNIVFIFADDMGWKDPGYMGNPYHETPRIDSLAKQGVVFTNAYANAPNCAPSRASLMTGQYSPRHGIYTVGSPERGKSENRKLIRQRIRWNWPIPSLPFQNCCKKPAILPPASVNGTLRNSSTTNPLAHGFDLNIGGDLKGSPKSHFSPYQNPNLPDGPDGEYLTDRLTDEA